MGRTVDDSPMVLERPPTPAVRELLKLASLFARRDRDNCTRMKHLDEALAMLNDCKEAAKVNGKAAAASMPLPVFATRARAVRAPAVVKSKRPGFTCAQCGRWDGWYKHHKSHVARCTQKGGTG